MMCVYPLSGALCFKGDSLSGMFLVLMGSGSGQAGLTTGLVVGFEAVLVTFFVLTDVFFALAVFV